MKKLLLSLLALASLVLSGQSFAQQPSAALPYCGTNSQNWTVCFKTRSEAEDHIRADPDGTHPARKLLEHDSTSLGWGNIRIWESYAVRPTAGTLGEAGYRATGNHGGAGTSYTQVACEITGTTASYQSYGPASNCINQPALCTYGYYCKNKAAVLSAISEGVKRPNCAPGSAWESVAPPAYPMGWNGSPPDEKPIYPPNTGHFQHHGSYQGEWLGGYFDFEYQSGTDCTGLGGGRLLELMAVPVTCPPGFYLDPGTPMNVSAPCKSREWGYLTVYYSATDDKTPCPDDTCGGYGDPIFPATGNTVQTPAGWDLESMLGVNLAYNSATTDRTRGIFGGGWNSLLQIQFAGYESTWRHWSIADENGNVEIFYTPNGNTPMRALGSPGKVLWSSVENGCEYIIHEANRRVVVACGSTAYPHYGRLLRIEYPNAPEKNLTFDWATSDGVGPLGNPTWINTISSVTRADGRRLDLHYGTVNTDPSCLSGPVPFACNARRLFAISDSDGHLTSFSYNAEGRLELISYPDGHRERFEYGNPADVCPASMPGACDGTPNARMMRSLLTGTYIETARQGGGYDSVRRGTYQFDNRGRAIRTSLPDDAMRTEVSYAANGTPTVKRFVDATHFSNRQIAPTQVSAWQKPGVISDTDSTGALARSMRVEYDANGYQSKTVDYKGVETLWTHTQGFATQRIEAANDATGAKRTTQWDWDITLRVITEQRLYDSAAGVPGTLVSRSVFAHNARGQRTAACQVDPANATAMSYVCGSALHAPVGVRQTRMTYCEDADVTAGTCPIRGQLLSVDGPRTDKNDVTSFSYYSADSAGCGLGVQCTYRKGDLRLATNAMGHVTEFLRYDGAGRLRSARDANGVVTDLEYGSRGWLTASKQRGADDGSEVDDAITRFTHDAIGNILTVTQPDGVVTTLVYDGAGRVKEIRDSNGGKQVFTLDMAGNASFEETRNAAGVKRSFARVFNDLGQLSTLLDANSAATQFTYDLNGASDLTTDPLNRVTNSDTDALDRVLKVVANVAGSGSDKATTEFRYDARDNLRSVVDPKGLTTSYTYDGSNNLTQLVSPDTGTTIFGYDAAGNRISEMKADGKTEGFVYDALGRLTSMTYVTAGNTVGIGYDTTQTDCAANEIFSKGRLTRITDRSGSTRLCYDRRGNLVRKVQTVSGGTTLTVGTTYNGAGKLVAMTYPSGAIVTYGRDDNGQINAVGAKPTATASQVLLVSGVTYLPFGPLNTLAFGNGRVLTKAYDQNYDIDSVSDSAASNPLSLDLSVNGVGNITGLTERTSATATLSRTFNYDGLDRLTAQKNGAATVEGFSYDATGNRLSKTTGTTANYTYPATSHRLTSVGSTARTYNLTGETTKIGNKSFGYDERHRLVSAGGATYMHNGLGQRVSKKTGSKATTLIQFVYDEAGHLIGEYSNTGARLKEYVWLGDTLVAVLSDFDSSTYQYVETDHLGTPRAVVHPSENVIAWRWDLNPTAFGEHTPNANPDGDSFSYTLNLRFPGQYFDSETGLNYNYFRDYDPTSGRYIQSDPIGLAGGVTTYAYVGSNSTGASDPLGLMNVGATQIATDNDPSSWKWGFQFSFSNGCKLAAGEEAGRFFAGRAGKIASGLSKALSGVDTAGPGPAGDADIQDFRDRCKCLNFDPQLEKYFKDTLKGNTDKLYSQSEAAFFLDRLHSKFDQLAWQKCGGNAECIASSSYYKWDKIIQRAIDRGAISPKGWATGQVND